MTSLMKSVFQLTSLRIFSNSFRQNTNTGKPFFTRSLWNMCSGIDAGSYVLKNRGLACSCGCNMMRVHTKQGVNDLVSFLTEEIAEEKEQFKKAKSLPSELDGFKVSIDGSEVILAKTLGNQAVEVIFNVNHSIAEEPDSVEEYKVEVSRGGRSMKSTPNFDVELKQGKNVLRFTCSYLSSSSDEANSDEDVFGIDEVTSYEGEWKETNYTVSADILDGFLYDKFMNLLEDKGVSNEFMEKVSELSTLYEHNCYISLLENIQKFASNN